MLAFSFASPERFCRIRLRAIRLTRLALALLAICLFNISLMGCGEKTADGQTIRNAEVTSRIVSMRTDPVIVASEIDFLKRGTPVKILGKTPEPVRIAGKRDYWYNVRLESGVEGWIYGANLSVGVDQIGSGSSEEREKALTEELAQTIVGKWWEVRADGSTGYGRIYFWADGKYKQGLGRGELRIGGDYEIDVKAMKVKLDKGSFMGEQIEIRQLGAEYRLYGTRKEKQVILKRAFIDPDAPEPGEEGKEAIDLDPSSDASKAGLDAASGAR